jgi:hypothetical protein
MNGGSKAVFKTEQFLLPFQATGKTTQAICGNNPVAWNQNWQRIGANCLTHGMRGRGQFFASSP